MRRCCATGRPCDEPRLFSDGVHRVLQYARRDTGTDSAPGPIDIMTGRIKPRHEVFVLVVPRSLASKSYDGAVAEGLVLRRS